MWKAGNLVGDIGLHGGAAAAILLMLNMVTWAAVTALLGGGLALIGLGLIVLALNPARDQEAAAGCDDAGRQPIGDAVPA